ncbi:MAG TPA: S8 family serine peptidase [Nitrososphaeraceae archaeon]|nr:S8 family serine peptidase [Nitrososphaeraceae archaeon]
MKKEYYVRGKKIEVEELTDVLAIKTEGTSEKTMDIEKNFGTRTKLSTDKKDQSKLDEEQKIFENAGYIFIKPNDQIMRAIKSGILRSELPNAGRTFIDQEGGIKIGTGRLTIKFHADVPKNQIESFINEKKLKIIRQLKFADSLYEVEIQDNIDPLDLSVEFYNNEKIIYAEPIFNEHIAERYIPTDPQYSDQWQWNSGISIQEAWDNTKGEGIKVAVIDNGMDISNTDLSESMISTAGYFKNNGLGETIFVKDINGFPKGNHGTFCSGMAIGRSDNGKFGCGAANRTSFIAIACLNDQIGSQVTLARSIAYAANPTMEIFDADPDEGTDILSCSLGPNGGHWTMESVLEDAIIFATSKGRNGLGTTIFWAVDNSNQPISEDEVCSHPNTIAVGRSRQDDMEDGSAYGQELDFLAPGVDVYSTYNNGGFDSGTGTSYATPCAAGVGALVLSINPKLSWNDIRKILRETCDKIGGVDYGSAGHHPNYGYGRINASRAVKTAINTNN